jgi:hypothetical protein
MELLHWIAGLEGERRERNERRRRTMKAKLPDDVMQAIEQAKRTAGWNNRRGDVQRFELANAYGHAPCLLYVVPARRWAYRRWERQAAQWQHRHGGNAV